MNARNPVTESREITRTAPGMEVSEPLKGASLTIGTGFEAQSFRARDIGAVMDPLVMVDHYVMTESTFGAHPHAGLSAISLLFADSEGRFHNRDTLGNDFDLQPGDLYWLSAGSGAVHDESPRPNARIHGLQVFVNVPESKRFEAPSSLLVRAEDMPTITGPDYHVKIALGESNGLRGATSPSTPMTILDGTIQPGGRFTHGITTRRGIWVHSIAGNLNVEVGATSRQLAPGQAVAIDIGSSAATSLANGSGKPAHFALFEGEQIAEPYVQDGPFVMGTEEQIKDIRAAYDAGQLGNLTDSE